MSCTCLFQFQKKLLVSLFAYKLRTSSWIGTVKEYLVWHAYPLYIHCFSYDVSISSPGVWLLTPI